ncbi:MAG: hypothetical protein ACE5EX_02740 [Phycisphaerae bacterium]
MSAHQGLMVMLAADLRTLAVEAAELCHRREPVPRSYVLALRQLAGDAERMCRESSKPVRGAAAASPPPAKIGGSPEQ